MTCFCNATVSLQPDLKKRLKETARARQITMGKLIEEMLDVYGYPSSDHRLPPSWSQK